jgi:hypothetical protein
LKKFDAVNSPSVSTQATVIEFPTLTPEGDDLASCRLDADLDKVDTLLERLYDSAKSDPSMRTAYNYIAFATGLYTQSKSKAV